ncbi:MAG: V-type ATP synthase subunit A [Spirochaetales bacterium]|nr:V-type ATP synthase subunit A [Spirochaetales bacterium]MBP7262745.1 V-type ATP synthase subunit A [Spirochaetia bacterium]
MNERIIARVRRITGPVIEARDAASAHMLELVRVGDDRLVGEVIKLADGEAVIQVYEDTSGLAPGAPVYGSGLPLSLELGPGLIGSIYDGIQRPLDAIRERTGTFIGRGVQADALDRKRLWAWTPVAQPGARLKPGDILGTVRETERLVHKILVPPETGGSLSYLAPAGDYAVDTDVAILDSSTGQHRLSMIQRWPIRVPRPVRSRLAMNQPLITGQRVIDTLFPLAKGGTVAIPGGFGTGKTMTQHAIAKWCDADIIVYIGCGERGNEMTDVLTEFPRLVDPRTGRSLMERTVLIANTSNMPVSAREASIYTGVTIAEYFRDMGLHVAVMADSTSRWAEALRELSGRMEEMPAEEGFPAYLPTRIAEFYERAGLMETLSGQPGSVSIIGAVSPPGGDFSEPVTQHTRRYVRCFWGLDRNLANARHYPAISWLDSYSEYVDDIQSWWLDQAGPQWSKDRAEILELLRREVRLLQVVKLVGPDALPDSQRFVIEVCELFKNAFLQQNAFDNVDRYSSPGKQQRMLGLVLAYWRRGSEAIKRGVSIAELRKLKVLGDIVKMKFTLSDDDADGFGKLAAALERAVARLEAVYA